MRILLSVCLLAAASSAALAQSDEVTVEGIGLSRSVPCDGRDVGIYGANNKIDLTGACGKVIVHGSSHVVTIESASALTVSGAEHTVTAAALGALSIQTTENTVNATMVSDGTPAIVEVNGADQVANLTLASATDISVGGTGQAINWSLADGAPEPKIDMGGIDNAVNRID